MNPSPHLIQTVALIDPLSSGHHAGYAATLARQLRERGVRVHLIGPAELLEAVCRAVPGVTGHALPLFPGNASEYHRLGRLAREKLNLRFLRAALQLAAAVAAEVAHVLWLDSFILPLLLARLECLVRAPLERVRGQPAMPSEPWGRQGGSGGGLGEPALWQGVGGAEAIRLERRTPRLRATLHWTYFLRVFRKSGGGLSQTVHRVMLRMLGALGVRVMLHSRHLIDSVGTGTLDLVPYPAPPPQTTVQERDRVRQAVRNILGLVPEAMVLLAFGGTRHDKGSDLALEALALLPTSYHLLVVGPPRAFGTDGLRQLAQRLGLSDRVHLLLEHVPDEAVEGYFLASDAALLPYRRIFAGQSGPLLIAASLGVPVLAANVGVLAEMVKEYGLGHLFAAEDPAALARCVLAFDPEALAPDTARFRRDHTPEVFARAVWRSYLGDRPAP